MIAAGSGSATCRASTRRRSRTRRTSPRRSQNADFDPGRKKSLPWQSGFAGICWNKEQGPERPQVGRRPLGARAQGQGRRAERDARHHGPDHAPAGRRHLEEVQRRRVQQGASTSSPRGRATARSATSRATRTSTTCKSGDTLAAICWSGDITQLNAEAGDNWEFALPEAGGTLWSDNFVIPIGSPRKANAEEAHQLLLRARGRGRGRRLGELHHAGGRRQGGGGQDRPGARRQPADLPRRHDAVERARSSAPSPRPRSRSTRRRSRK